MDIRNLRGRIALVTGAASGIGRESALAFGRRGADLVICDLDEEGLEQTATDLQGMGRDVLARRVDVADPEDVRHLAEETDAQAGVPDILMNNAGVGLGAGFLDTSLEDWDWILGVNVYGIIHGIRSFVPRMIAQDSEGHVVNTASVAAFVGGPTSGPYVVSKCAAFSLTESLAYDLGAVGSKLGASVLTPSTFDTGIAHTARVRPERYGTDPTPDGKGVVEVLSSQIEQGRPPSEIVAPVLEAVRSGTFLIPTMPSYQAQIRNRFEALLDRRLPGMTDVD